MNTDIGTRYKYQSVLRGVAHISAGYNGHFGVVTFECGTSARISQVSSCSNHATTCKTCERVASSKKEAIPC